jgi:glycosyltransferase involved in cell wall biosynthesis
MPLRQIFKRNRPLLMLASLLKEMLAFRPHMVLASQFGDLSFATLAGLACRALVLGGVRSDGFYELRTSGRRAWLLLRLADGFISNSHRARENLASRGVENITVVPNVIDLSDFDRKALEPLTIPLRATSDRMRVAAIGSLQRSKRFDVFLEGLAWARWQNPHLVGVIAGKDLGERPALEAKAKGLGLLPDQVEFLGECHQTPALLARSGMLVSCSEYEGFPNVILEAMAARLPVVATPAGDTGRIVQQGITGYLLESGDAREVGERILSLAENPALATQMGEAGRRRVEQDFDFNSLAERLLAAFSTFARAQRKLRLLKLLQEVQEKPAVKSISPISPGVVAA